MIVIVILLAIVALVEGFMLYRAAYRLLQFDDLFSQIMPIFDWYAANLKKTLSSGLLEDHPDVKAFHRTNMQVMSNIEELARNIHEFGRKAKLPPKALPPDVE